MRYEDYWENICKIHSLTKHYLLLSEELSLEGDSFIQPLKEHRDAYDHIIRVYAMKNGISNIKKSNEYMEKNMSKALGHEYRAFFDTADWLALICRERINTLLKGKTMQEIEKKYPKYRELKLLLLDLPYEIADLRENKDIGKYGNSILTEVDEYVNILDSILNSYNELYRAIENL